MEIVLSPEARKDLIFWKKSGNKQIQKKIEELIIDIQAHPFSGIGQPEALKFNLSGFWSRRINREHRIIYKVVNGVIEVTSLKGHY
jgi:toxin YoeB